MISRSALVSVALLALVGWVWLSVAACAGWLFPWLVPAWLRRQRAARLRCEAQREGAGSTAPEAAVVNTPAQGGAQGVHLESETVAWRG